MTPWKTLHSLPRAGRPGCAACHSQTEPCRALQSLAEPGTAWQSLAEPWHSLAETSLP